MQTYTLNANGAEREQVAANIHAFIDRLPATKSWRVEIKEAKKQRSDPQNHALFGVAYVALSEVTGYTKDELHTVFCKRYFGAIENSVLGDYSERAIRTTTRNEYGERDVISKSEFSQFYAMVQQIGAEAGIDVPSPDALHNDERMKK